MSVDVDTELAKYRSWLTQTALGMNNHESVVGPDDIAQEGYIAMWKAFKRYDATRGPLDMWLKANARWKMKTFVQRQIAPVVEDATDEFDQLDSATILSDVELAYHHGAIADAIARLSPKQREYVLRRFWCGEKLPELKEAFGYDPTALWSSPRNGAKHKLRRMLYKLESATV